LVFSIDFAYGP